MKRARGAEVSAANRKQTLTRTRATNLLAYSCKAKKTGTMGCRADHICGAAEPNRTFWSSWSVCSVRSWFLMDPKTSCCLWGNHDIREKLHEGPLRTRTRTRTTAARNRSNKPHAEFKMQLYSHDTDNMRGGRAAPNEDASVSRSEQHRASLLPSSFALKLGTDAGTGHTGTGDPAGTLPVRAGTQSGFKS